jgi:hypothetical protein
MLSNYFISNNCNYKIQLLKYKKFKAAIEFSERAYLLSLRILVYAEKLCSTFTPDTGSQILYILKPILIN